MKVVDAVLKALSGLHQSLLLDTAPVNYPSAHTYLRLLLLFYNYICTLNTQLFVLSAKMISKYLAPNLEHLSITTQ